MSNVNNPPKINRIHMFLSKNNLGAKIVYSLIIIFIIFGIIGFCIAVSAKNGVKKTEESSQKNNDKNQKAVKNINEQMYKNSNLTRGETGAPGIQGPAGPTGGVHNASGRFINVQDGKSADVTQGVGQTSISYLNNANRFTNQYWTYDSNNRLVNKFNRNCLQGKDNNLFMNECNNSNEQKFIWNDVGQMVWQGNTSSDRCISTTDFVLDNQRTTRPFKDGQPDKNWTSSGNVKRLNLEQCSDTGSGPQQKWTFN